MTAPGAAVAPRSGPSLTVRPASAQAPAAERRAYTRTEVPDPAATGVRVQGKVFLTVATGAEAGDYVCSGTAVNSLNRSVVWTAGHCVYDSDGGYVTNFLFVPGYKNGTAPFGEWPAVKLASPDGWRSSANSSYDFSAAEVAANGAGKSLTEVVGGRGIAFNQSRTQSYSSFGYPAQQPPLEFNGLREFRCDSPLGGGDDPPGSGPNTMWIGCDMTGGSSGGGWVAQDGAGGNSYSYCEPTGTLCQERLYGPYFGDVAKQLYATIGGVADCGDEKVTVLGTGAADDLTGNVERQAMRSMAPRWQGHDLRQGWEGHDLRRRWRRQAEWRWGQGQLRRRRRSRHGEELRGAQEHPLVRLAGELAIAARLWWVRISRGSARAGACSWSPRGSSQRRCRVDGGDLLVHGLGDGAVGRVALAAGAQLAEVHRLARVHVEHVADPVAEAEGVRGGGLARRPRAVRTPSARSRARARTRPPQPAS